MCQDNSAGTWVQTSPMLHDAIVDHNVMASLLFGNTIWSSYSHSPSSQIVHVTVLYRTVGVSVFEIDRILTNVAYFTVLEVDTRAVFDFKDTTDLGSSLTVVQTVFRIQILAVEKSDSRKANV